MNEILESKQKSEELVKREDIDKTPFTIISVDKGKTWFGTLGKYRITEEYKSKTALKKNSKQ